MILSLRTLAEVPVCSDSGSTRRRKVASSRLVEYSSAAPIPGHPFGRYLQEESHVCYCVLPDAIEPALRLVPFSPVGRAGSQTLRSVTLLALHAQREAHGRASARSVTGAFVLSKHNRRSFLSIEEQDFAAALEGDERESRFTGRHGEHKTRQLCRQVQRALNMALAERGSDPVLDQLFVEEVSPAPGCGHLLVHFVAPADRSVADVLVGLKRESPRLRAQMARAISRKQAPELSFVPAHRAGGEDV